MFTISTYNSVGNIHAGELTTEYLMSLETLRYVEIPVMKAIDFLEVSDDNIHVSDVADLQNGNLGGDESLEIEELLMKKSKKKEKEFHQALDILRSICNNNSHNKYV